MWVVDHTSASTKRVLELATPLYTPTWSSSLHKHHELDSGGSILRVQQPIAAHNFVNFGRRWRSLTCKKRRFIKVRLQNKNKKQTKVKKDCRVVKFGGSSSEYGTHSYLRYLTSTPLFFEKLTFVLAQFEISVNMGSSSDSTNSSNNAFTKAEVMAWCSAFSLMSVLIVTGNLLTIVLFAANKKN